MAKNSYTLKVRAVRDTLIDCIQELSNDKENLLPNLKVIKELTSVLKEMDRIDERDDKHDGEKSKEEFYHFYDKIKDKVTIPIIKTKRIRKEKKNND